MNEPNYIKVEGTANTVSELIKLLQKVPSDYDVTLSGMCCFGVLIDTNNKTTLIDDVNYIDTILEEQE